MNVLFGHYPQRSCEDDYSPIEWIVLARENQKVLLIAKYALDYLPYDEQITEERTTWQKSTLRIWLNETFMKKAFTSKEQQGILTTNVDNSRSQGEFYTDGGKNTQDKVFLLSHKEASTYFLDKNARVCAPTMYAFKRGAHSSTTQICGERRQSIAWWLRSPGFHWCYGIISSENGSIGLYDVVKRKNAVRPALWVNLDSAKIILSVSAQLTIEQRDPTLHGLLFGGNPNSPFDFFLEKNEITSDSTSI